MSEIPVDMLDSMLKSLVRGAANYRLTYRLRIDEQIYVSVPTAVVTVGLGRTQFANDLAKHNIILCADPADE